MTTFHLTVIAKAPVPGRVKTRLVPPLTAEQAAQIAAACLRDTFEAVAAVARRHDDVRTVALVDGDPHGWVPTGFELRDQRGDGLGERLANGFADLGPGVIIGMDTPSVGPLLDGALTSIRAGHDAIGMTFDGGYWGIALAEPDPAVFDGVEMSTDHTGTDQLARLRRLGRNVTVLPSAPDLDTFDDIAPLVAELPGSHLATVVASLLGSSWG